MNNYKKIWFYALPLLKKGKRKDFVSHTKEVVKAIEIICKQEKGNKGLLIPAAILHDIGWSKVSIELQMSQKTKEKLEAMKQHIKYAPELITEILSKLNYDKKTIKQIINIVSSHKFSNPRNINKRILIDADNLSDVFKKQFLSDIEKYKTTKNDLYKFRKRTNKFYTRTAQKIFNKEIEKRIKE
jgi:HD superfamily phosphodiesterase